VLHLFQVRKKLAAKLIFMRPMFTALIQELGAMRQFVSENALTAINPKMQYKVCAGW
jgi:hypothetical protein